MLWIPWMLVLPGIVKAIGSPHYECGENGRFEYCIDNVPGCIVGCHCHPGYYFDTETKICEPNAKLVLEFRRLFGDRESPSPTRVPPRIYNFPDNPLALEPTPTPPSAPAAMDDQVESIAKESDDLGDWLYNQFFKTIESQVINNADNVTGTVKPSRRSGGDLEMPKRKSKKQTSKRGKSLRKNARNKTDLRRKLLRITEDDSLFDSSSGSSEGSSSSVSSSDDSSGDRSPERKTDKKDSDHPHRRILMINKKPKPPLPSFIFLPQMQTPFFPPIGLPPPAMPMYPMVPVPPMFVSGQNKPCAQTTSTPGKKLLRVKPDSEDTTTTTTTTKAPKPNNGTLRMKMLRANKHAQRKKLLRQLQERMQNSKMSGIMEDLQKPRRPLAPKSPPVPMPMPVPSFESPMASDAFPPLDPNEVPPAPGGGDVDFKYLGQLIHKMDNKTGGSVLPINGPPDGPPGNPFFQHKGSNFHQNGQPFFPPNFLHGGPPNIPPLDKTENSPPNNGEPTRRFGNELTDSWNNYKNRRFLESPNEQYYSNLGQQIAGLIRRIDSNIGHAPVDIEIERNEPPGQSIFTENSEGSPAESVFIESSNAPRSYWDRSVRSLLRQSNYQDNLFNLENRVETFATTTKPLSLPELENFVFLLNQAKSTNQQPTETPDEMFTEIVKMDNGRLKVNLLAKQNEQEVLENSNDIPYDLNRYSEQNMGLKEKVNKYNNSEVERNLDYHQNTITENKHDNYDQRNEVKDTQHKPLQLIIDPYKNDRQKKQQLNKYEPKPPNTKENFDNYGYLERMSNFWNGKTYNKSDVFIVGPDNLRSLLLTNIKRINPLPKHLSYNMKDMSISNKDFIKNPMISMSNLPMFGTLQMQKRNKTYLNKIYDKKTTIVKPQKMSGAVGTNLNKVAQVWNKPSDLPWNLPGIGGIFTNKKVYRVANQHTHPQQRPINIQVQIAPQMTFRTIKGHGGDKFRSRQSHEPRQLLLKQMLTQETKFKHDSPLFQHHLVHHYDVFN